MIVVEEECASTFQIVLHRNTNLKENLLYEPRISAPKQIRQAQISYEPFFDLTATIFA